jgi:hypothetical protein
MISEPAPVLHTIGSRPTMAATIVIIFGRTLHRAFHDGVQRWKDEHAQPFFR